MANRKVLFRSGGNVNEVSPSADSVLIASIDQGSTTFTLKTAGVTLYSVTVSGLMAMNGPFSLAPATDDTGTIGVDPGETGGDPLAVGALRRFSVIRGRKLKSGMSIVLENSLDIGNSADGVGPANTGRIKYESATQALRASENGGALADLVLTTKIQTLSQKTLTTPTIADFTNAQHTHTNAAGGGAISIPPSRETFRFVGDGNIITMTNLDGTWIAPRACTIKRISLFRRSAGSGGSTTVDVNKQGVTVFTTQANRPSIAFGAGNNVVNAHTDMDVTAVAQDDRIDIDVDAAETGSAKDLSVVIEVEYT